MPVSLKPPQHWGFVCCTSENCLTPMLLYVAKPLQPVLDPDWWPHGKNWVYVACPECKLVYAYIGLESLQNQNTLPVDKLWLRISFRCAVEDCKTPVQFHVLINSTVTEESENEWREKLRTGYWRCACPSGHPSAIVENQKVSFDRIDGERLRGYNPDHPLWNEL